MHPDTLDALLRLRRRAVDEARTGLAGSLAAATRAAQAARAADQAIEREMELASEPDGDDGLVEAFAAWLPAARRDSALARHEHERNEAEVARCRANVTASQTALETIEALVARRTSYQAQALARRMQAALDEAAQRPAERTAPRIR